MIDQRFSFDAFALLKPNTREAEELSDALARAIATEMQEAIAGAIQEVVEQVRGLGHNLKEVDSGPGHFTFGSSDSTSGGGRLAIFFHDFVGAAFLQFEGDGAAEKAPSGPAPDEVPF